MFLTKYSPLIRDEHDIVSDVSLTVNCMRKFWSKTDEAAACFRCCIPPCDRSTAVENELAGVFKMFNSKNASWKRFFFNGNKSKKFERQAGPSNFQLTSRGGSEDGSRCYYRFCVFSVLHHPILLHHSFPSSFPLNPETCTFERKVIKITNTLKHSLLFICKKYCTYTQARSSST